MHDDYHSHVHPQLFAQREDAEAEVQKMIQRIHEIRGKSKRCEECRFREDYWMCKKHGGSDESFISKYKHKRSCSDFEIDPEGDDWGIWCKNYSRDCNEEHEPHIVEYELIISDKEGEIL